MDGVTTASTRTSLSPFLLLPQITSTPTVTTNRTFPRNLPRKTSLRKRRLRKISLRKTRLKTHPRLPAISPNSASTATISTVRNTMPLLLSGMKPWPTTLRVSPPPVFSSTLAQVTARTWQLVTILLMLLSLLGTMRRTNTTVTLAYVVSLEGFVPRLIYEQSAAGHFSQLVWKGAKKVGCGQVDCAGKNGTPGKFFTCNYDTGMYSNVSSYPSLIHCR
jgi:hypothetical protein